MKMKIKLDEGAITPTKAHKTDAGFDLYAIENIAIRPHCDGNKCGAIVDTGVHFEIPEGFYGIVAGRSGLNFKQDIIVPQGTIDCGFSGSVKVKLYNLSSELFHIHKGDRIAQIIFMKHESPEFEIVDDISETERGDSGFGDSGR